MNIVILLHWPTTYKYRYRYTIIHVSRNLYTLNHVTNLNEFKNVFIIMSSVSNNDRFKKNIIVKMDCASL